MKAQDIPKVPILLLTYRKHQSLKEIFDAVATYNPSRLYISQNHAKDESEEEMVQKVRKEILAFNFPCETILILHDKHLPISHVFETTLNAVFAKEEKLIVLEDDTVPSHSFFTFCSEMLHRYENRDEVGCINGCNLDAVNVPNSYFYSGMAVPFWGWATWKSRWSLFRNDNRYYNLHKAKILDGISVKHQGFFAEAFYFNAQGVHVWDMQWNQSLLANGLKTILPGVNLVTNKGFVAEGTSINYTQSAFSNLLTHEIEVNATQLTTDQTLVLQYESQIVNLFKEINSHLKGTGKKRLLNL